MWFSRNADALGLLSRFPLPPVPFPVALALSLGLHLLLAAAWLALPPGEPGAPFAVYQVRLVQAPSRPQARRLDVAREAPSALESAPAAPGRAVERPLTVPQEGPRVDLPGALQALAPEAPGRPGEPAQTALAPAPALPQRQRAQPAPQAPVAPQSPLAQQAAPLPQAPALPPAPMARSPRPPAAPAAEEEPRPPSEPPQAWAPVPPAATGPLEDVRRMVGEQAATSREAPRAEPAARRANPLAELARRRYRGGIQTRVQENYNYPGNFICGTQARGQITIARDGSVLAWELLESSGDERFDYALNLTVRATKFQPLPDEIPGESVQERITFVSKNCTRRDTQ